MRMVYNVYEYCDELGLHGNYHNLGTWHKNARKFENRSNYNVRNIITTQISQCDV